MKMMFGLCAGLSLLMGMMAVGAAGKGGEEDAIRGVVDRFMEAWNRHDAHAFAALFAEDADFTNVMGMGARGRAKIEEFHASSFLSMFKDSHLTYSDLRVRLIRPDVAMVDVWWRMTGATDRQGKPWPNRKGLVNFVAAKEKGQWEILVMHNQELGEEGK
jgi:uncharacterized protein (TIGR02246 family)